MILFCVCFVFHWYQPGEMDFLLDSVSTVIPHPRQFHHSHSTKNNPSILSAHKDSRLQTLVEMGKLITGASNGEFKWTVARGNHSPI